ncbi:gamma-glutamyltranspeptidase / glutathione hydrolase [Nakamurella panacisegetis]|uniref:Gamma-glutamyltranspeptidase / glutathione hydrolase n=1 Tax=Nakamurella panacisegetis TaxID=1090615 RepID=A0A1H0HED1_9ACTN|nr:gamma-glutamyltransferase [Nakamurella panacisegetis]SDO17508.1 gamma-glutamyltranspeptidase / glutathione hydrolase [Nakamurella panacisegetis]
MNTELRGTFGMVATTHYLASAVGMAVLEAGGNAVDAAVAAGFTLQVAEPHLNGPGGDMTLLVAAAGRAPEVLCGQGPAPAGATPAHYIDLGLDLVPGTGHLAAAIPGSTMAWLTLFRDRGTKSLSEVLGYAIGYARGGVPVLPAIHRVIDGVTDLLRDEWPTSAAIYLRDGHAPAAGSILTNPALADTYERLLRAGGEGDREQQIDAAIAAWRTGFVAAAVDEFARVPQMDSSGERHAGVITGADLAGWAPTYEPPVSAGFGEWTVYKAGPWSQGPVLLQQLQLLEELGIAPGATGLDPLELAHTTLEVTKLAFADREAWYGDSAAVPLADLLSPDYTASRAPLVGPTASMELRPGRPGGRTPRLAEGIGRSLDLPPEIGIGEPTVARDGQTKGDTCHIDVVDRWGGMVAATPSGGWLQSSPVIPALGFGLGTRLQMSTLEPGLPASLMPGRRPRTTLSPSMAGRGDRVEMAFGTPGGDQQDQWQLGFLLRLLLDPRGRDLQRAIDGPSFHCTAFPSSFYPRESYPGQVVIEERFPDDVLDGLAARGHQVVRAGRWALGRMCAVARDPITGWLAAGADPRSNQAYAAGR